MKSFLLQKKWIVAVAVASLATSVPAFAKDKKPSSGGGGGSRPSSSGGSRPSSGGGFGGGSPRSSSPKPSFSAPKPSAPKSSYSAPKPSNNPPKSSYTAPKPSTPKPSYTPPKSSNSPSNKPSHSASKPAPQPRRTESSTPKPSQPQVRIDSKPKPSSPSVRNEPKPSTPKPQVSQPQGGHKRTATNDGGYIEDRGNHQVKFRADGSREYVKTDSGKTTQYRKDGTKAQETNNGQVTNFPKPSTQNPNPKPVVQNPSNRPSQTDNRPNLNKPVTGLPQPRPQTNHGNQPQSGHKRTATNDGGYIEDRGNHQVKFRADGSREYVKTDSGKTTQYRKDGSKAQESKNGRVTTYRPDGSYDVTVHGKPQYTQSRVQQNNDTYIRRTYTQNNTTIIKNYRTYVYGGYDYYSYVPSYVYDGGYYTYLHRTWSDPYYYSWQWRYDPWYGTYHYYYRPYRTYYAPSYWITDYLIADMLSSTYQAAYEARAAQNAQLAAQEAQAAAAEARQAAADAQAAQVVMTEEIKDQIKAQVEEAIRAHERHESIPLQENLKSLNNVFVVSDDIEVGIEGTQESCSLTGGDIVRLRALPAQDAAVAEMTVVTGKRESCRPNTAIVVSMQDLQEFQNSFVERVEKGMEKMKQESIGAKP